MFELFGYDLEAGSGGDTAGVAGSSVPVESGVDPGVDLGAVWVEMLAGIDGDDLSDGALVDELAALERLTGAAAAAKARLTAQLHARRLVGDAERGVPTQRCGRGVAHEVALARRESPHAGRQHVGLAVALVKDMPVTLAALAAGEISEQRAMVMVRESADLSGEDRACVDATLGPVLGSMGNREVMLAVRRMVCDLDPEGEADRVERARARRRVTSRGLGHGMMRITADVPSWDGYVAMQALREHADFQRVSGVDTRSRDQVMADEFLARLGEPTTPRARRIEIQLVMSAEMLLGADRRTPAHLVGYGPIPARVVADLLADPEGEVTIRRLFANPADNALVAMDSAAELFSGRLRRMVFARDGETCRTPYCDAPVRHADHITPRHQGGATTLEQGQGLCAACNYAKESPGWRHRTTSRRYERHTVEVTTPTGHTHISQAPPIPVPVPAAPPPSSTLELHFVSVIYKLDVDLGA
ncbi:HNH endonuclease [Nocardioides pacificus]